MQQARRTRQEMNEARTAMSDAKREIDEAMQAMVAARQEADQALKAMQQAQLKEMEVRWDETG